MEKSNATCCPKCQSSSVRPDREKSLWDFFYTLILQRPMRCRDCRHRFGALYDPTVEKAQFEPRRIRRRKSATATVMAVGVPAPSEPVSSAA